MVARARMEGLARGERTAGGQDLWRSYGLLVGIHQTGVSSAGASRTNEGQEPHLRVAGTSRTPCARAPRASPIQAQVAHRICLARTLVEAVVPSRGPHESPNPLDSFCRRHAILCHMGVRRAEDDAQDLQGKDRLMEAMRAYVGKGQGFLKQAEGATAGGKMHQIAAPAGRHPSCRACGRHYTYRAQADTGDACRCDLSVVVGRQQGGGCRTLQETACESVVRICVEARERWTEREGDTQMDAELAHDQAGISCGSGLLDGHDRQDVVRGREGLIAGDERAPPTKYRGHQRVQAGQSFQ